MGRKFTTVPLNTFDTLQVDAGVLLKKFNPTNPVKPQDSDLIAATKGGINISCVPTFSDYGEDVDNVPNNMMELKNLDGWDCKFSTTCLGTSPYQVRLTLGAADIDSSDPTKIIPRRNLELGDFSDIWWVGDMANGGFVAVQLKNALSTGGFSLQTTKNGKGEFALELTGHVSINDQDTVPMVIYSSKVDSFEDVTVTADDPHATYPWTDKSPEDFQSDIDVIDNAITGSLFFIEGGLSPSGPLAGDGYFLALKFSDLDPDATSVKVGLDPSKGTGLVEIINDPDKNAVMKIDNKDEQVFKVVSSNGTSSHTQVFDLSGLELLLD